MTTLLTKHSTFILISLLLVLFALAWLFPSAGFVLGVTFLLLSFLVASFVVVHKQKELYRHGKISRSMFLRNTFLGMTGTGLAMICAGVLGRFLAEMVTRQIGDDLTRFAIGILIGILTGIAVGIFASHTWGRFVKTTT